KRTNDGVAASALARRRKTHGWGGRGSQSVLRLSEVPNSKALNLFRRPQCITYLCVNGPTVRTKCGLVELARIEPRSLVGSRLKPLSPTLAEGAKPPRMLPTKGAHPLRNPRFQRLFWWSWR